MSCLEHLDIFCDFFAFHDFYGFNDLLFTAYRTKRPEPVRPEFVERGEWVEGLTVYQSLCVF